MVENFRIDALRVMQSQLGIFIRLGDHNQSHIEENGGYKNSELLSAPKHIEALLKCVTEVQAFAQAAETMFGGLGCTHINHAISSLRWWADGNDRKWSDLKARAIALRNAIDNELKEYLYYQYPKIKGQKLQSWKLDWQFPIVVFPEIEEDIFSATDCYAMGHNTAAVFHCMRILEHGLSALASELGLSFDIQQWQNIIEQIEAKIGDQRKTLPRGAEKNQKLQFLSEAAKEFFYFKDGWRNYVSHNRGNYDSDQAISILEHTRSFMCHLASQLPQRKVD